MRGDGEVIGVGVLEVGDEDDLGLMGADHASDFVSVLDGVLDSAVGEVEQVAADWVVRSGERACGGFCFGQARGP